MQAPSQNSPLCAYQPSGLAQSYSTATTHHLYPLFSFCKIRSRTHGEKKHRTEGKKFKRGLQTLQAAAVIKIQTRVCRWTTTWCRGVPRIFLVIILIAIICVFYLLHFVFSSLLSHRPSFFVDYCLLWVVFTLSSRLSLFGYCFVFFVFLVFFGKL